MLFLKNLARQNNLLIELGNCISRASIWQNKGDFYTMIKETEAENPFFRDGVIRKKGQFIEVLQLLLRSLDGERYSNIVIGLDSSYISYNSFEIKSGNKIVSKNEDALLSHLNTYNPDHKLIHLGVRENRVACLSIPRNLLDKIYLVFSQMNLSINKFIPINYLRSAALFNLCTNKVCMVIDIGYRATSISVFEENFLINYKTVPFGIEHVVFAVAQKNAISVNDARVMLGEIPLFGCDERDWISYDGKYFRMDKVSELLNFYITQLARKLVDRDYCYVNNAVLSGWAQKINGIDRVFKQFIPNITIDNNSREQIYSRGLPFSVKCG